MKVAIVGGGPAGLFFSTLLKRAQPKSDVTIYEQNAADATYGFGVVFTDIALRFLDEIDKPLRKAIVTASSKQDQLIITHRNVPVSVGGNIFYGISRLDLLNLLREEAVKVGVRIIDNRRIDELEPFAKCDLIVGADGLNSTTRNLFKSHFQASIEHCRNMWAWYGTARQVKGVNLIFQQTPTGLFIGHTYPYGVHGNTFVVECAPDVWRRAGLDIMSDEESRSYCAGVFSDFLAGETLLSNRSVWFNPAFVRTRNWSHGNVVLIGDALKTVHPTIGSGTRVGMQDAIALAGACVDAGGNIPLALTLFEERRRPDAEGFQDAALRSVQWYEAVDERLDLSPLEFAYDYMMRTGKMDRERLRRMDPEFVLAYERSLTKR